MSEVPDAAAMVRYVTVTVTVTVDRVRADCAGEEDDPRDDREESAECRAQPPGECQEDGAHADDDGVVAPPRVSSRCVLGC